MPATAEKVQTYRLYSRGRSEKLIRQPLLLLETATGRQIKQQDRVVYDFAPDGRLEVREGQDVLADGPVDPATGEPTEQDAVAWLMSHPLLNERFWVEGYEPGRPLPTERDFMAIVTQASALLQEKPIVGALEQEMATHNRPVLVAAAEDALEMIRATNAELAKQKDAG